MFESEHYTSISALASIGEGGRGGAMVGNGAIVPGANNLLHTLQAIKLEVGLRKRLQE